MEDKESKAPIDFWDQKVKIIVTYTPVVPTPTWSVFQFHEGRNILQDIRSGEEQYFTGPNQNLPDRKI